MFNAVVIGCGKIGGGAINYSTSSHGYAYRNSGKVCVLAGVDLDKYNALRFSDRHNCEYETCITTAMRTYKPEVVSVCTPDETHSEVVDEIYSSGHIPKLVFIEKPVCKDREQFAKLIKYVTKYDSRILVNHSRRFDSPTRTIREMIRSGDFGSLYRIKSTYYGGWIHNGCHLIDTLRFLINEEIHFNIVTSFHLDRDDDPTIGFNCFSSKSKTPIMICGVEESTYQIFEFDLWFREARVRIEDFGERILIERVDINKSGERILIRCQGEIPPRTTSPIQNAVDLLVKCLSTDEYNSLEDCGLEEVQKTMETLWQGRDLYEADRLKKG